VIKISSRAVPRISSDVKAPSLYKPLHSEEGLSFRDWMVEVIAVIFSPFFCPEI
jgi:hypothetical protein